MEQSVPKCRHKITYEDGTECSETSAYKIQAPWRHPKERMQQEEFHLKITENKDTT